MQTDSADYLFQSDAQLASRAARTDKAARLENAGEPIKVASKILDLLIDDEEGGGLSSEGLVGNGVADSFGSDDSGYRTRSRQSRSPYAWTAESGFVVRCVNLESGKTRYTCKGHAGPVTSIARYARSKGKSRATDPGTADICDMIMSGSWDKSIRTWNASDGQPITVNREAHSDFVKSLLVVPELQILVSGGSDKDIRIWDLASIPHDVSSAHQQVAGTNENLSDITRDVASVRLVGGEDPAKLAAGRAASDETGATIKGLVFLASLRGHHTRPVEALAYHRYPADAKSQDEPRICLWSGDSMGRICIWDIFKSSATGDNGGPSGSVQTRLRHTWLAHETAIYQIHLSVNPGGSYVDEDADENEPAQGEAWTVSGDQLATLWRFDVQSPSSLRSPAQLSQPKPVLRLPHPSYVKAVLPLEDLVSGSSASTSYVVTGSTDETIRVWDLSLLDTSEGAGSTVESGRTGVRKIMTTAAEANTAYKDGRKPAGLVYELEGHFHEVVKLGLWWRQPKSAGSDQPQSVETSTRLVPPILHLVSASLDCTIRKWPLSDLLSKAITATSAASKEAEGTDACIYTAQELRARQDILSKRKTEQTLQVEITAEEEAELAELMGED